MFFIPLFLSAQQGSFNVEYYKTEGSLTGADLYMEDFGRYDGYQMPLNKGERAYFIVYSEDFSPNIVLVTPGEEVFKQVSSKGDDFVATGIDVPETGEWFLYVLADSVDEGDYLLQYGFTDSVSLSISPDADFCNGLNYLTAHANAYFIFPQTVPDGEELYIIEGADNAFINGDNASYYAAFYHDNDFEAAEQKYNSLGDVIKNCINKDWKVESTGWVPYNEGQEKSITWTENVNSYQRVVKVVFTNLSEADNAEYPDKYLVDLVISKY